MSIEFECEACQKLIRVPEDVAGQQARCPYCQHVQVVSGSSERQETSGSPYRDEPLAASDDATLNPYAAPSSSASAGYRYADVFNLATRGERFFGAMLDIIFNIACFIPAFTVAALADSTNNPSLEAVGGILMFVGIVGYAATQWTLITRTSQSVGKRLMGTRIIKLNGTPPGFVHGVILRNWILGFTCICYPIGGLMYLVDSLIIFGDNRQCLHDIIASTLVVSDKVPYGESSSDS